jgi:hypothetical protein
MAALAEPPVPSGREVLLLLQASIEEQIVDDHSGRKAYGRRKRHKQTTTEPNAIR